MILGYIAVNNKKQAKEITKLLLEQNLIFTANISTKKVFKKNKISGVIENRKQTIIEGKTKALLFNTINKILRKKYPKNMPMFYAVPIIYMDDKQTELLRSETAKV
ncbi:divalent cation tolerance protein CutA [Maribacter sp. ACAM166]|uniref:divalent cation tolerance protein CutA n=1 Tax=Maribacter sp. ACAM166 TaxID=2508996 RepID=UPI0010FF13BC|nr:divalent cation tolerance protein CutA [Maribacter sp. ACAM166]TLP82617.1 divalent cation tolerance protein CutA [Maribacter sp. ACAM166]